MIDIVEAPYPHPYPLRVSEFTQRFWKELAEGRFMSTRDAATGVATFPPKPVSPSTWSEDMDWFELAGTGTLYSHTTIHASPAAFVAELPYTVCIVDLDENLRLATRYLSADPVIGERVEIVAVRHTDRMSFAARRAST